MQPRVEVEAVLQPTLIKTSRVARSLKGGGTGRSKKFETNEPTRHSCHNTTKTVSEIQWRNEQFLHSHGYQHFFSENRLDLSVPTNYR